MAFKSLVTNTGIQAQYLLQDLKIGHYMHLSPIKVFAAQFYGTFVGSICTTLMGWSIITSPVWLERIGTDREWLAIGYETFFNAGAIWGAVGPRRFFLNPESMYLSVFISGWVVGAILPFIPWLFSKMFPATKFWRQISIPLIVYFGNAGSMQNSLVSQLFVALTLQFFVFKYYKTLFCRFNYTFAAAVSAGAGICVLLVNLLAVLQKENGDPLVKSPEWTLNPQRYPDFYCFEND